jgi:tRNA 5-methylaminomethyl-2-thiouridine biosynthesis bifunctional protein
MWTPELFQMMARLARPGCTLATFTAAGFVRRGLQEAGFTMAKSKGFGPKRSMLIGEMTQHLPQTLRTPWYARTGSQQREVALIGGGIASALLALALLRRGWQVTLYCADEAPALGASGNRQGALYPLLSAHDAALAHFFPAAFTFARRLYDSLPVRFDHDWCGVTQLAWDEKSASKIEQMLSLNLPPSIAFEVDAKTIADTCGVVTDCDGITYPQGGWLYPAQLTALTLELARKQGLNVFYNHDITDLKQTPSDWQLTFTRQPPREHQVVVLANGHKINHFSQTQHLPVYAVGGQVSHIPTNPVLGELRQVLCYDGYLTPVNPENQHHCIGASYHRGQGEMVFNEEDQQYNRQRLINCLPDADWPKTIDVSGNQARCGVRCATRDHLPMVGNVPNYEAILRQYATLVEAPDSAAPTPVYPNLFMLAALGSRGLCSAPLSAEILAAQMSEEPIPMDTRTLAALNPNRLWIRKLLKGKAVVASLNHASGL